MSENTTLSKPILSDPRNVKVRQEHQGAKAPLNITRRPLVELPMRNIKGDRSDEIA